MKINRSIAGAASAALIAISLGACTTTLGVRPDYVAAGISSPAVHGRASLVMDAQGRAQMFNGGPNSLTGAGTSVSVPIGAVIEGVGEKVCSAYFSDGASVGGEPVPGNYVVRAMPAGFSYKFDQLSNLGFAVTPKVTVAVRIGVTDPSGAVIVPEKTYERTDYSATGAYFVSLHPQEKINQSLHMAVADIFREAMDQLPKR